jgi:CubicO group peptidase (beta-lactamase class C family)
MSAFVLSETSLENARLRPEQIARLTALIERHIAEGRYPGAQIAIARQGLLALFQTFGDARVGTAAGAQTLWLLYSNTKVITAATTWILAEQGAFRFTDRVSDHVPEFAANGKRDVTIMQVITHMAGYPNAQVSPTAWEDHAKLRAAVCDFRLEFTPGSRLHYHGQSAHWTLAVLIEVLTGRDFRDVIRETLIAPMGLFDDVHVGLPRGRVGRAADMYEPVEGGLAPIAANNSAAWRKAGSPGAGGYATARGMAAFYQMMLGGGTLGGTRIVSQRMLEYAIRNWTGDAVDGYMGMPMHRGLGPHLRGTTPSVRGLGALAHPLTFGHGGVGSSYCWGDPVSGVSFAYLTNCRVPDPWHSLRLDTVSNLVHAAIV